MTEESKAAWKAIGVIVGIIIAAISAYAGLVSAGVIDNPRSVNTTVQDQLQSTTATKLSSHSVISTNEMSSPTSDNRSTDATLEFKTTRKVDYGLERILGVYQGKYLAVGGEYWGVNLNVYTNAHNKAEAIFSCWTLPEVVYKNPRVLGFGSWRCSVEYNPFADTYSIVAIDWIEKNSNWVMDSFYDCKLSENGRLLSGIVISPTWHGTGSFTIDRTE